MNIQDLPNETLTKIAGYLAFPSQAIVAVALTAESAKFRMITYESQILKVSKDIITSAISSCDDWDTVDFGDIELSLTARLSDDDIESIFAILLRCELDHRVRSVFFTGCMGIKGNCIRPLRYFANLLHVDLSLVGRNSGAYETDVCSLEHDAVIDILNLHVRGWGCLKLVRLPDKFIRDPSDETRQFLHELSESIERRGGACSNCDAALGFLEYQRAIEYHNGSSSIVPSYGRSLTCCGRCLEDFCQMSGCHMFFCQNCRTNSCRECVSFDACHVCLCRICNDCREVNNVEFGIDGWDRCRDCGEITCEDCFDSCPDCNYTPCMECSPILRCERCGKQACEECGSGEEFRIDWCEDGYHCFCKQCRMDLCMEGLDCGPCMALIGRDAVDSEMMYAAENVRLKREIAILKMGVQEQVDEIKLTVKEHEDEIASLRKRVQKQDNEIKEQEEEIKRLKGEDSDEATFHIEEAMGELDIE